MTAFLDEYMAVDESGADSEPVVEDDRGTEIPEYVRINLEHAELTARIASLSQELTERRAEAMKELVASVLGWCDNYGFARADMMIELNNAVPQVKAKPKSKAKAKAKVTQPVTLFAAPACPGHIYKRGPYPAWMRERMVTLGLDPGDVDSRREYKKTYLQIVG